MQIRVLGCSGGIGPGLRTTSLLIDDVTLIDAGTGVGDLTMSQLSAINRVFLTHSHLDHVCGLAFMADNLFDVVERPIRVSAQAETIEALRKHLFNWVIWPDFSQLPTVQKPLIQFEPLTAGQPVSLGEGCTLTAFEVLHTVPAVGYALESPSSTFAFSGDTYATDKLWSFLNALDRLDSLMIEIAFPDEQATLGRASGHFSPGLLGEELKKLRHHPQLYLTHAKPGAESAITRQCERALHGWQYRHLQRGDVIDC